MKKWNAGHVLCITPLTSWIQTLTKRVNRCDSTCDVWCNGWSKHTPKSTTAQWSLTSRVTPTDSGKDSLLVTITLMFLEQITIMSDFSDGQRHVIDEWRDSEAGTSTSCGPVSLLYLSMMLSGKPMCWIGSKALATKCSTLNDNVGLDALKKQQSAEDLDGILQSTSRKQKISIVC